MALLKATRASFGLSPEGSIHRIQIGSFLGRDHGRVVEMGDAFVAVTEIVSDGTEDGWVERPRTIELTGK